MGSNTGERSWVRHRVEVWGRAWGSESGVGNWCRTRGGRGQRGGRVGVRKGGLKGRLEVKERTSTNLGLRVPNSTRTATGTTPYLSGGGSTEVWEVPRTVEFYLRGTYGTAGRLWRRGERGGEENVARVVGRTIGVPESQHGRRTGSCTPRERTFREGTVTGSWRGLPGFKREGGYLVHQG